MPNKEYDLVVIGSGMGGLVCALLFAKEGYKVCVLERNKQIGGTLQTFSRDKVIFDSGVHYVGGLGEGQNLNQIFKYLNIMDKVKIHKLDEDLFDALAFEDTPEKIYKHAQGYERFIQNLVAEFPEEEAGIRKYCDEIQRVCSKFPLYNLRIGDSSEKNDVLNIDTKTFIESITNNKRLQNVLGGTNLLYAGEPYKTPLYVHALILNSYIEGAYRFVNGGSQIAKYLASEIRALGGEVKTRKDVISIVENNEAVEYVECGDGDKYYGKYFISNAHPAKTLDLVQSNLIKKIYRNRIQTLENSPSTFLVNIVLKKDSLPHRNYNIYYFRNSDTWSSMSYSLEDWPRGFAVFYSHRKDQDQWADSITLMAYMRLEETKQWMDSFNTATIGNERGMDYDKFKDEKAQFLIDCAEKVIPGLKESIHAYYVATPLTLRDYIGTDDGSLYGISKDFRDPMRTFISPKTKISNLFLTGQNLNLHGILGVTMSAIVTSSEVFGMEYLLNKIRNA